MITKMCLNYSIGVLISTGIIFLTSGNAQTNLPKKVSLPEDTETGTEIFRVEFDEGGEGRSTHLQLYSMFPAVANDIFEFNEQNYSILIKNGSLLDFEGEDKAYVIRLDEVLPAKEEISEGKQEFVLPKQDLTVLIELQDVLECSQFVSSSSDKGCCDDVRRIIWLTPVTSSLEVIVIVISIVIVMMCFFKKERTTRVEAFNPGK